MPYNRTPLSELRRRVDAIEQAIALLDEAYASPVALHESHDEEVDADTMYHLIRRCKHAAESDLRDAERARLEAAQSTLVTGG